MRSRLLPSEHLPRMTLSGHCEDDVSMLYVGFRVLSASNTRARLLLSTWQRRRSTGEATRVMSIQSIISEQAPALNVLRRIPPNLQRDVGLRPLPAHTLRLAKAESMSHLWDAVDGLPRRHRGRTAYLRRIVSFSAFFPSCRSFDKIYFWKNSEGLGTYAG